MRLASSFSRNANVLTSEHPLTDDQIRSVAPSVFADHAHESRSSRYTFIPTSTVLDGLRREGFQPFAVAQSRARDASRHEFTKHLLRFRRADTIARGPDGILPEVIIVGSHDGTTSYQMLAGLLRLACMNGLVTVSGPAEEIRVHHKGDVAGRVIEGAYTIVNTFDQVFDNVERLRAIPLLETEQRAFARAALVAKYGEPETGAFPITEEQVLRSKRTDDEGRDLWSTYNRVQEHLLDGGLRARSATGRRLRTRPVTGISQNVALNKALWTLADEMAKLKAAA